ncbi:MAG: DUF4920 domain-containing protein [Bdellovibrionales bacterium]
MKVLVSVLVLSFGMSSFAKDAVSVEDAIKNLKGKFAKVLVSGEIGTVCQSKGCWLTLRPSSATTESDECEEALKGASTQADVRVMFGDHAFTVPKDLTGKVVVKGKLKKKKLSSFQLKHLMKDAGCSKAQMKKAKKAIYKYQIIATEVRKDEKVYSATQKH